MPQHPWNLLLSADPPRICAGFGRRRVASTCLGRLAYGASAAAGPGAAVLSGDRFDLTIGALPVNITGKPRLATVVNGSLPAPTLRLEREGDTVTINVTNHLNEPSSIHWHGILLPNPMDGVPGSPSAASCRAKPSPTGFR